MVELSLWARVFCELFPLGSFEHLDGRLSGVVSLLADKLSCVGLVEEYNFTLIGDFFEDLGVDFIKVSSNLCTLDLSEVKLFKQ